MNRTARVVYNHEPEPEGNGTLYGGTEVEVGTEAEGERSIVAVLCRVRRRLR